MTYVAFQLGRVVEAARLMVEGQRSSRRFVLPHRVRWSCGCEFWSLRGGGRHDRLCMNFQGSACRRNLEPSEVALP